jgi:hypothetical protein
MPRRQVAPDFIEMWPSPPVSKGGPAGLLPVRSAARRGVARTDLAPADLGDLAAPARTESAGTKVGLPLDQGHPMPISDMSDRCPVSD